MKTRGRRANRKLTDEDVRILAEEFEVMMQTIYMPKIQEMVDSRVKQVLTHFYQRAQKANENDRT